MEQFGAGDFRTLLAAAYLAYASAADHLDGQLEVAHAIMEET